MKYQIGAYIHHPKRGTTYQIEATPDHFKVRDGEEWLPGYLYRNIETGEKYARRQDAIEGRAYVHAVDGEGNVPQLVSPCFVVSAANRFKADGLVIPSARHYDSLMHAVINALGRTREPMEQGFIDCRRNFLTREQAHMRAMALNQRRYRCGGDERELYSENLY